MAAGRVSHQNYLEPMRTCTECQIAKPLTEYYVNKGCIGGRNPRCKKCVRDRHAGGRAERAKRDRAYFQQVKLDRGCTDCGYASHPAALEFDHLPGFMKRYRIATMAGMRRSLIDEEIAKCEVVCANCHRVRTAARLTAEGLEAAEAAESAATF